MSINKEPSEPQDETGSRFSDRLLRRIHREVFKEMNGLYQLLEDHPDKGRLTGKVKMDEGEELLTFQLADGETEIQRRNNTREGTRTSVVFTQPDESFFHGYGNKRVHFGASSKDFGDVTDRTKFPEGFPQHPKYYLSIYLHTDLDTLPQVAELSKDPYWQSQGLDLFTRFYFDSEKIGKIIFLNRAIQDPRTPYEELEDGRTLAVPVKEDDLILIKRTTAYLRNKLTSQADPNISGLKFPWE